MFHVLRWLRMYVANLCSKCFICFQTHVTIVFLWMLQNLVLEVVKVHLLFSCARIKTERAEPRARLERSGRDDPTGPARVQWSEGGADLP
jgi:hypothetical protein